LGAGRGVDGRRGAEDGWEEANLGGAEFGPQGRMMQPGILCDRERNAQGAPGEASKVP
jgi:hypothetical protein